MHEEGLDKYIQIIETPRSIKNGYELGNELFAASNRPTAIFAATDTLAIGIIKAAFKHHIVVPHDISVVGYDDIDIAPYTVPALTTISQSGHQMGYKTATLLLDMMQQQQDSADVEDIVLKPELIVRESTAPLLKT